MSEPTECCRAEVAGASESYCGSCDLLVGLDGFHVVGVDAGNGRLTVMVETAPGPMGCPTCGVVAHSHGRRVHTPHHPACRRRDWLLCDIPAFGQPVPLVWRVHRYRCPDPGFLQAAFS